MPIGFDNPYLGLAAGYFANRRPGVSSLASLGGGFQDVMQQQVIKKQQEREQKRFEQQQERADIQNKALLKQIKRQEMESKAGEAVSELLGEGLSPKNKALVNALYAAGHHEKAVSIAQNLLKPPTSKAPLGKGPYEVQLLQRIAAGDESARKELDMLRAEPSESAYNADEKGKARAFISAVNRDVAAGKKISADRIRDYQEQYKVLNSPSLVKLADGEIVEHAPVGTTFPAPNELFADQPEMGPAAEPGMMPPGGAPQAMGPPGGAPQSLAQGVDPNTINLPSGGVMTTVREGREPREPAPVIKAREAITTAQTGIEEVQTILDFLAGTSAPVTGLGGFAQRNFAEGIFPSVQEAAGGKVDIETPATDFQLMVDNLKTQNRVALTGGGNTSVAEWERIDKMIQGLDWKASRAQTEASLRAIQKNMEAVINKNRVFAESMGVDVAEPLGPYQPNPDLTPEQNAIMEAYHLDKMSIEEAKAAMRATGVED